MHPTEGPSLEPNHRLVVLELIRRLGTSVVWALTGSQAHVLHGLPLQVHDIDVQTDEDGAYRIADLFQDAVVRPVQWRPSPSVRSHFGELRVQGITIDVMGALQRRLLDGSWEQPVDVAANRVFVDFEGQEVH